MIPLKLAAQKKLQDVASPGLKDDCTGFRLNLKLCGSMPTPSHRYRDGHPPAGGVTWMHLQPLGSVGAATSQGLIWSEHPSHLGLTGGKSRPRLDARQLTPRQVLHTSLIQWLDRLRHLSARTARTDSEGCQRQASHSGLHCGPLQSRRHSRAAQLIEPSHGSAPEKDRARNQGECACLGRRQTRQGQFRTTRAAQGLR